MHSKRLFVLDYGLFQVHQNGRIIGIPGFLIQTHDGKNILVDTGFPAWYADDPQAAGLADGLDRFGQVLQLTEHNLPGAQLALCGLKKADITHLVMTHSDIDHVGGINDFTHAALIIGRAERALPQPRYFGSNSPIDWPQNRDVRLIDADCELCPGVELLSTPGHSPGHLSLLIRLAQTGAILLTGDAISRPAELVEGFGDAFDPTAAQASAERLMAIAAAENALVIFGHDPQQWGQLRKAPLAYE